MKGYCGCNSCRKNGEVNPHELFEIYLAQRDDELLKEFSQILSEPFSAAELNDMEAEFFDSDVVNRINQFTMSDNTFDAYNYWRNWAEYHENIY